MVLPATGALPWTPGIESENLEAENPVPLDTLPTATHRTTLPPWTPDWTEDRSYSPPPDPRDPDVQSCIPHPPIRITEDHGDEGFTWTNPVTGEVEHRPGSGVTAGSGTEQDPFVIGGWCLTAALDVAGIEVSGTSSHVRIQRNQIVGVQEPFGFVGVSMSPGVLLNGTSNVHVSGNLVVLTTNGIFVQNSDHTMVVGNTVNGSWGDGITLWHSTGNNVIRANEVTGTFWYGIWVDGRSWHNLVDGNDLRDNGWGAVISGRHNVVRNNSVVSNDVDGVDFFAGDDSHLDNNVIAGNGRDGLRLWFGASRNLVQNNTIERNENRGIFLAGRSDDNVLWDNVIANNGGLGVEILRNDAIDEAPEGTVLRGNNVESNGMDGLLLDALDDVVDATENWWGDVSGPSGGVVDACTGRVAAGTGESIAVSDARVCFDAWLDSANPGAGVD